MSAAVIHHLYLYTTAIAVLLLFMWRKGCNSCTHALLFVPYHSCGQQQLSLRPSISRLYCRHHYSQIADQGRYEIARYRPLEASSTAMDSSSPFRITNSTTTTSYNSEYLIEFRGLNPPFRYDEFMDAYHIVLKQLHSSSPGLDSMQSVEKLRFTEVIPDTLSEFPIGAYVTLPSSRVASLIAARCAMVRRIIQVWGDASTMEEACAQAITNYHSIIHPMLHQHELDDSPTSAKPRTWWVNFERYGRSGRSGLDVEGKRSLLSRFQPLFQLIGGSADSTAPTHELLYLEDWHSYQRGLNALIADRKASGGVASSEELSQYTASYSPHRCVWGRVLAVGPSIVNSFDLRYRPFVGTTSMNALSAHLCAVAAQVEAGQTVLDPFCGTGSLLIAAAHLGAAVVGGDIDADCLGRLSLPHRSDPLSSSSLSSASVRSKNARFKRKNGITQLDKSTRDNFVFYGLEDKLLDLIGVDASQWVGGDHGTGGGRDDSCDGQLDREAFRSEIGLIKKYDKFDAIVTDPPFGKREKAFSSRSRSESSLSATNSDSGDYHDDDASIMLETDEDMGSPSDMVQLIGRIAVHRLKPYGRLVFFLPTKAFVTKQRVYMWLQSSCANIGPSDGLQLRIDRVVADELNTHLWRWMCVLQLVAEPSTA